MTLSGRLLSAFSARPARARLRPTRDDDLSYVLALERDPTQPPAGASWAQAQHEAALRFADYRHLILEAGPGLERVGFVVLAGCRSPEQSIEIKRLVCQPTGRGHGRAALQLIKPLAFEELGAQRLWLEVRESNVAARLLADTEGFVLEGRLREAVRRPGGGREALIVMAMLAAEYPAQAAREPRA